MARAAAQKPPAIEAPLTVPSVYSDDAREKEQDRLILQMVANLEQEEIRLDTLRKVNLHEDEDLVPGESRTYKDALAQLNENRQKLARTCGEEQMERVKKLAAEL